ncbi:MAG: SagB/ThcOx family dehydrogenase [Myxococcota bacterium]
MATRTLGMRAWLVTGAGALGITMCSLAPAGETPTASSQPRPRLAFPKSVGPGPATSVDGAIQRRRSIRSYSAGPSATQVAQLLWAAQGITDDAGHRTAPSAGATYPLELYLVAGSVEGLSPGVYRYLPQSEEVEVVMGDVDQRPAVADATGQGWVGDAPAIVIIAGVHERTAARYGERAPRYVAFEAGAASENLALQAVAMELGTVVVGAFDDARLAQAVGMADGEAPLAVMPLGVP